MRRRASSPGASPPGEGAREAALSLLARRAHGEGELRHKLLRKGFGEAEADAAVSALRSLGLVDDGELLPRLVRYYGETRGYGRAKVAAALRARRFDPDGVAAALRDAFPEEAEILAAAEALRKKYRRVPPQGREGAGRAYRFLAGRGFSPSACRAALGAILSDIDEGEPSP